jgi:hypothetical protein
MEENYHLISPVIINTKVASPSQDCIAVGRRNLIVHQARPNAQQKVYSESEDEH